MSLWKRTPTSITTILSPINGVIADLDKYQRTKLDEADYFEQEAMSLQELAADAHAEAHRAFVLSKSLKELMTADV